MSTPRTIYAPQFSFQPIEPSTDPWSLEAFEEDQEGYLQNFQKSSGKTQENYRKTIEEEVFPFLRAQAGLSSEQNASISFNLSDARYTLTKFSLHPDLILQQKALSLLLEVLYKDPFDPTKPTLSYKLLDCEELLRSSLEIREFQKLPPDLQIQRLTAYGALIANILGYYALENLGAVTKETKLEMSKMSKALSGLNTHKNPQLKFALLFVLEGIKRLHDDQSALSKTIECLIPLLRMAGALYRKEMGEALENLSAFTTAFQENVDLKQGWYDSILSLHHIARKTENEGMQLLNLQAWILIKDRKQVNSSLFKTLQTQIQRDANDWKFFYSAAELLARIGKSHSNPKIQSYALLGTKGPIPDLLPGLFSFYDLEAFKNNKQLRYLVVKLTASFWNSPDPAIREEASKKIDQLLLSEKEDKVRKLIQKEKLSEHQRKSEGIQLQKLLETKTLTEKKQLKEKKQEEVLSQTENLQDKRVEKIRLDAQTKKTKEEVDKKQKELAEKQAALTQKKNTVSNNPTQQKALSSEVDTLDRQIKKLTQEKQELEEKYKKADLANKSLSTLIASQKKELEQKEQELKEEQSALSLKEQELQALEKHLKENQRQAEKEIAVHKQKIQQEQAALQDLQKTLLAGQQKLEVAQKTLRQQEEQFAHKQRTLEQEKTELTHRQQELDSKEQKLLQKEAQLLSLEKQTKLQAAPPQVVQKLEETKQLLQQERATWEKEKKALEEKKQKLSTQEEHLKQELLTHRQKLQEQEQELQAKQQELQAKQWEVQLDQISIQSTQDALTLRQKELEKAETQALLFQKELERKQLELQAKERWLEEREKALLEGRDLPTLQTSAPTSQAPQIAPKPQTAPKPASRPQSQVGSSVAPPALTLTKEEPVTSKPNSRPSTPTKKGIGLPVIKNASFYLKEGQSHFENENLDQALISYNKAIELDPECTLAYRDLGTLYYTQGNTKEALSSYEKALDLDPTDQELKDLVEQLKPKPLKRPASPRPRTAQDLYEEALSLCHRGSLEEAIRAYQKTLELDPKFALAYRDLGTLYHQQQRQDLALSYYEKALELSPQDLELKELVISLKPKPKPLTLPKTKTAQDFYNEAQSLYAKGSVNEAIPLFQKSLELNPQDSATYHALGNIFYERNDQAQALTHYEKALALDPNPELQAFVASIKAEQNRQRQKLLEEKALQEKARLEEIERKKQLEAAARMPPQAFGKKDWEKYFGDIGQEPKLPSNIHQILQSACPIWPNKKVQDTHLLTLIPEKVNGKPLTLNYLQDLVKNPKGGGNKTEYSHYNDDVQKEQGARSSGSSYWVLMTKDVLPNTRSKSYDNQLSELNTLAARAPKTNGLGVYQTPKALEAATSILMEYVKSGVRLYPAPEKGLRTFTRCEETVCEGKWRVVIGGFAASGLLVPFLSWDSEDAGLGGARKCFDL